MSATPVPALHPPAPAGPPPEQHAGQRFGLPTASALVVGSVIGTGVFALPSALAAIGPISLVAFGLVLLDGSEPAEVSRYLLGGITKSDLSLLSGASLTWQVLDIDPLTRRHLT